ncbi:MAG TPA: metal ABC transporter substrate-binding protein [Gaiellaceae bacterium]|nr:metal ABC transporter substrate-binding protein [Gaiellaceae bacterium]
MRVPVLLAATVCLVGCSRSDKPDDRPSPFIVASVYPLVWAAEEIGGKVGLRVVNLTRPGAEPHDVELSPRDVEAVRDAALVLYVGAGFQPAVEDAVEGRERRPSLDVLGREESDPHVWLDPVRFAEVVEELGAAIGSPVTARDVAGAVRDLDSEYRRGLAQCERRTLVTSHRAFGQLAERYDLTELSLAGRSPEAEPSPRELERLINDVRASGATTVFAEPLVSDRLAETVAREAGIEVAVLDPIEGLSQERLNAGEDYLTVMRTNLAALRRALACR